VQIDNQKSHRTPAPPIEPGQAADPAIPLRGTGGTGSRLPPYAALRGASRRRSETGAIGFDKLNPSGRNVQ